MSHRRGLTLLVVVLVAAVVVVPVVAGWLPVSVPSLTGTSAPRWRHFQTREFSLDLPTAYAGGDTTGADFDQVVSTVRDMGGDDNTSLAEAIQAGRHQFAFWAFDLGSLSASPFPTGVSIASDPLIVDPAVTLDDLAGLMVKQLPPQFRLQDSASVRLGEVQAHRLEIVTRVHDVEVEQAMYLVRQGNTIWRITFATPLSEFGTRLASFDESVQSLALTPAG